MIDEESPVCVLCGQALTESQLQAIKVTGNKKIEEFDPIGFLASQITVIENLRLATTPLVPRVLGEDDLERIRKLLEEPDEVLGAYVQRVTDLTSTVTIAAAPSLSMMPAMIPPISSS